jgi:hypothetical protein
MKKIVINICHGGFDLSKEAMSLYYKRANVPEDFPLFSWHIPRNDQNLIDVVEELEHLSWGKYSQLKVVEIPDDVEWEIAEYDGVEWVAEKHRKWN